MSEIIIDRGITQSRIGLFNNGTLERLYIDDAGDTSISGNIYIGRIENIVVNMKAAFVNLGFSKNALLHFEDIEDARNLVRGSSIVVQVIREAVGEKGPRVSGRISIPGKYMVIHPETRVYGVSKKIVDEVVRKKLKEAAHELAEGDVGIVLRTEAAGAEAGELRKEYESLSNLWNNIRKYSEYVKAPKLLFNSRDFLNYIFREFVRTDVSKIYFNRIEDRDYFSGMLFGRHELNHIELQFDEYNFSPFTRLQDSMEKLKDTRIELPSGGFLVVDKTEAATVIDVNSGSHNSAGNFEDTVLLVNLEAARAIFNHIRLHNLSGIILVDFINMENKENKFILQRELHELFKMDIVTVRISNFTEMGLIEISRARKGRSAVEYIYKDIDKGELSGAYALKNIENICVRELKQKNRKQFEFYISPYLKQYNDMSSCDFIKIMKRMFGVHIDFIAINFISNFAKTAGDKSKEIKVELFNRVIYGAIKDINEDDKGNIIISMKKL